MPNLTEEMNEWLLSNMAAYEFYMMHAIFHDPLHRSSLLATPLTPDDFISEEYALVIGGLITAQTILRRFGNKVPFPPTPEYMKTFINTAARAEGSDDDVIDGATKLVEELQDPSFKDQHYCVNMYFEAWYSTMRAKKVARLLQQNVIPDVNGIIEKLRKDLAAASEINNPAVAREFNFDNPPETPKPILRFVGHVVCTPGNISNIQGIAKTAKSAIVCAIMACALKYPHTSADTLGFTTERPEKGGAVFHFDTEQSRHDHDSLVRRAYLRAGRKEKADWLYSYSLTGMDPEACWNYLVNKIETEAKKQGGVWMIIIDGIADFCPDPNDAVLSFELVRKLHKLAIDYNCAVITVLHENPGSGNGKTRGHLGSQLERKAETSLRLAKNAAEITQVWTDRARHCFIPKDHGLQLKWCDQAKMHVTIHEDDKDYLRPKSDKISKYKGEMTKAFGEYYQLSYTDLVDRIIKTANIAIRTAKSRIPEYEELNLVEKTDDGKYRVVQNPRAA